MTSKRLYNKTPKQSIFIPNGIVVTKIPIANIFFMISAFKK